MCIWSRPSGSAPPSSAVSTPDKSPNRAAVKSLASSCHCLLHHEQASSQFTFFNRRSGMPSSSSSAAGSCQTPPADSSCCSARRVLRGRRIGWAEYGSTAA